MMGVHRCITFWTINKNKGWKKRREVAARGSLTNFDKGENNKYIYLYDNSLKKKKSK